MNSDDYGTEAPWYADGLHFACTSCGKCCTGEAGSVYLTREDTERLAGFFQLPVGKFVRQYTRKIFGRRALIDRPHSDECVFLRDKTCTVYEGRPTQCRTYPWWISNLQDRESWEEAAEQCEGINHATAQLIPASQITEQCHIDVLSEEELFGQPTS